LYDYDPLWFPMASLRHLVASALCQVAPTILGNHGPDPGPGLLEFGRVRDLVLGDQVGRHLHPSEVSPHTAAPKAHVYERQYQSGSPAFRKPSSYLARSSGLRIGVTCLTSEIRKAGSSWRT